MWVWVGTRSDAEVPGTCIDAELPVGDVTSRSRHREDWVWVWSGARIDAELFGTRIDAEGDVRSRGGGIQIGVEFVDRKGEGCVTEDFSIHRGRRR